jgi:hypothetical protein
MTFLTTRYELKRPLKEKDYERLARLHTVYGFRGTSVEGDELVVEYDASRIHEAEVLSAIRRTGIAVEPPRPIPPGAFDYTGEFKDFVWPTKGLSPVNQDAK